MMILDKTHGRHFGTPMKLFNFELASSSFAIELRALDSVWDLHNTWNFVGISLDARENKAIMRWRMVAPGIAYSGFRLIFTGLKVMIISPRDGELPYSEDTCISGVSKVSLDASTDAKLRTRPTWNVDDSFNLLFEFQSARVIEIGAEGATFMRGDGTGDI